MPIPEGQTGLALGRLQNTAPPSLVHVWPPLRFRWVGRAGNATEWTGIELFNRSRPAFWRPKIWLCGAPEPKPPFQI